jgi:hypothetical protein
MPKQGSCFQQQLLRVPPTFTEGGAFAVLETSALVPVYLASTAAATPPPKPHNVVSNCAALRDSLPQSYQTYLAIVHQETALYRRSTNCS